jgi:hypothetical protein
MLSVTLEEGLQVEKICITTLLFKGTLKKSERIICFVQFLQTHGGKWDSI